MEWNRCFGCMREVGAGVVKCPYCGYDITAAEPSAHHLGPGIILHGKYMVGRVLGEGGFGISYLGWDLILEMKVAIKEFFPSNFVTRQTQYAETVTILSSNQEEYYQKGLQKFLEEARALARLNDLPGIVQVKDFFRQNGTAYIVMGFAEGETLKNVLRNNGGKLPSERVFSMFMPIMDSLAMVHKQGMIHRDISPDNLMVDDNYRIKLLDFGAARFFLSAENPNSLSVVLKRGYAPVEQYHSHGKQGPWTDVYALCATMYRAITGKIPPESLSRKMGQSALARPSALGIPIDKAKENALMKGLAIEPEKRFQSMEAFKEALCKTNQQTNIRQSENIRAGGVEQSGNYVRMLGKEGENTSKKKKARWVIAAAAGVIAVAGIIFAISGSDSSEKITEESSFAENETEIEEVLEAADITEIPEAEQMPEATETPEITEPQETAQEEDSYTEYYLEEAAMSFSIPSDWEEETPEEGWNFQAAIDWSSDFLIMVNDEMSLPEGIEELDEATANLFVAALRVEYPETEFDVYKNGEKVFLTEYTSDDSTGVCMSDMMYVDIGRKKSIVYAYRSIGELPSEAKAVMEKILTTIKFSETGGFSKDAGLQGIEGTPCSFEVDDLFADLSVNMTMPADYDVFTRDISTEDKKKLKSDYGVTKKAFLAFMEENMNYVDAYNRYDSSYDIFVRIDEGGNGVTDLNEVSQEVLDNLRDEITQDEKCITAGIYKNSGQTYLNMLYKIYEDDGTEYNIRSYQTYANGLRIRVCLQRTDIEIAAEDEDLIRAVVNSIVYQ